MYWHDFSYIYLDFIRGPRLAEFGASLDQRRHRREKGVKIMSNKILIGRLSGATSALAFAAVMWGLPVDQANAGILFNVDLTGAAGGWNASGNLGLGPLLHPNSGGQLSADSTTGIGVGSPTDSDFGTLPDDRGTIFIGPVGDQNDKDSVHPGTGVQDKDAKGSEEISGGGGDAREVLLLIFTGAEALFVWPDSIKITLNDYGEIKDEKVVVGEECTTVKDKTTCKDIFEEVATRNLDNEDLSMLLTFVDDTTQQFDASFIEPLMLFPDLTSRNCSPLMTTALAAACRRG